MSGPDLPIHPGALSHYADPDAYQRRYAGREEDVSYYVRASRRADGAVLEYGCGNGRVTLALARAGVRVTGVDASRFMLDDLRRRLASEPREVRHRVSLLQGDMRTQRLSRRFGLVIMPFNVFGHLYDRRDVELLLGRVRNHLLPGGRLLFDVYLPRFTELAASLPGYHYDPITQLLTVHFEGDPPTVLTLRQFFPQELRMLLRYNGFSRVKIRSDFTEKVIDEDTDSLVVSATPMA